MGSGDIMEGVNYGTYAQAVGQGGGSTSNQPPPSGLIPIIDPTTGQILYYNPDTGGLYTDKAGTIPYVPQKQGPVYPYTTPGGLGYTAQGLAAAQSQYKDVANLYGYNITDSQIKAWIDGGVSPNEVQQRFEALDSMKRNSLELDRFEHVIGRKLDFKDRKDFVLGLAPAKFYSEWGKATLQAKAYQTGFHVGRIGDQALTKAQLREIQGDLPSAQSQGGDLGQASAQGFAQLHALVLAALPAARFRGYGINKDDLIKGVFAGDQGALDTANRIVASEAAKYKAGDQEQIVRTETGGYAPLGLQGIGAGGGQ